MAILDILNSKACFPVEVQFKNQLNQLETMEKLMYFLFSPVALETFKEYDISWGKRAAINNIKISLSV